MLIHSPSHAPSSRPQEAQADAPERDATVVEGALVKGLARGGAVLVALPPGDPDALAEDIGEVLGRPAELLVHLEAQSALGQDRVGGQDGGHGRPVPGGDSGRGARQGGDILGHR